MFTHYFMKNVKERKFNVNFKNTDDVLKKLRHQRRVLSAYLRSKGNPIKRKCLINGENEF